MSPITYGFNASAEAKRQVVNQGNVQRQPSCAVATRKGAAHITTHISGGGIDYGSARVPPARLGRLCVGSYGSKPSPACSELNLKLHQSAGSLCAGSLRAGSLEGKHPLASAEPDHRLHQAAAPGAESTAAQVCVPATERAAAPDGQLPDLACMR